MHETRNKKWLTKAQLAWARACSLKRALHKTVGSCSLGVRLWLASSDLKDVSSSFARLWLACGSLKRAVCFKFWAQSLNARLSDGLLPWATIHLGWEKLYGISNPISSKTPFSTPDYPKRDLTIVYRFNIQQCTTRNTKQQQTAIQLIFINFTQHS